MTPEERTDLLSLPERDARARLEEHFAERGVASYRVGQTLAWLYERDATAFSEMTDLSTRERAGLEEAFELRGPRLERTETSTDGTVKHLWRLADGELVESVLIPSGARRTLCISSQAGCAMACVFCATGWSGYRRQLGAGEIVGQYRGTRRWLRDRDGGDVSNVVFMGMGEPLMNRAAVFAALDLLNGPYDVGARRITVSTVGIVPGIDELARRPEQFRLALSLHAPLSDLRSTIVPVERRYPLEELMAALRRFDDAGKRRITFEYVLIDGVNDGLDLVRPLADLTRQVGAHVNLIPYNPIPGPDWRPTPAGRVRAFAEALRALSVNVTVREPRGRDIAAACGQLRAEHELTPPAPFVRLRAAGAAAARPGGG